MIVNRPGPATRRIGPPWRAGTWRCLARRGMLHSDCDSFDEHILPPGRRLTLTATGAETAVVVIAGEVTSEATGRLGRAALLLLAEGPAAALTAGEDGATVLTLRVMPARVSTALPPRVPELPVAERTIVAAGVPR